MTICCRVRVVRACVRQSRMQMIGMDQVALAMENIELAAVQNAAATKKAEGAVQNLQELGEQLKAMIEGDAT